jgi:hypothetical protein
LINLDVIKNTVHNDNLSHQERLLICVGHADKPQNNSEIKLTAEKVGLNNSVLRNISSYLTKSKGLLIKTKNGWELTKNGWEKIYELTGTKSNATKVKVADGLRKHLNKITDPNTKKFVEDSINCFEFDYYRAAVVLSWVGAVSLFYDHIITNKLIDFNKEAFRRDSKWKNAKSKDDLSRMKEYDFLQILVTLSVIGKNVKDELENCLKLRNGCGHPNSLKIGELRVSSHIEILILNVFSKF